MHPEPTKVTLQPVSDRTLISGLDPKKFVEITYYAPTYPDGATAVYPREEVSRWVERWLGASGRTAAERDNLRDHVRGLLGLLELVRGRSDTPPEIRDVLKNNHRARDAADYLAEVAARGEEDTPVAAVQPAPAGLVQPATPADYWDLLKGLRRAEWRVAVHNDYTINGSDRTFWLFTHPAGYYVKGEGATDLDALTECARQAADLGEPAVGRSAT